MEPARRPWRFRSTAVLVTAVFGLVISAAPAAAVDDHRHGGTERTTTSELISNEAFTSQADTAVVARADTFPDALTAAALAGAVEGPVLLTYPEKLSAATEAELERLDVDTVYVVGGLSAVGDGVRDALGRDVDIEQVGGDDRFETAAAVATEAVDRNDGIGESQGDTTLFIASGDDFADTLTASGVAYTGMYPVLYVTRTGFPNSTEAALDELEPDQAIILGGEQAVGSTVERAIQRMGISTQRIGGATRFDTSAMFSDFATSTMDQSSDHVVLSRGDLFPDALAGGPLAGSIGAPVLLTTSSTVLGSDARDYLGEYCTSIDGLHVLGGTDALADTIVTAATNAADC